MGGAAGQRQPPSDLKRRHVFPYLQGPFPMDPGSWGYLADPLSDERFDPLVVAGDGSVAGGRAPPARRPRGDGADLRRQRRSDPGPSAAPRSAGVVDTRTLPRTRAQLPSAAGRRCPAAQPWLERSLEGDRRDERRDDQDDGGRRSPCRALVAVTRPASRSRLQRRRERPPCTPGRPGYRPPAGRPAEPAR